MYELVYCSKASPDLTHEDILSILETAKKFNSENNITGCLLYYNQEFAQILEGNETSVLALFEEIKKDKRHSFVLSLGTGYKEKRLFPTWNMAYQNLNSDKKPPSQDFIKNFLAFSELADKPTQVSELFFNVSNHILSDNIQRKLG